MTEVPSPDVLRLDADGLNAFLARAFPGGDENQRGVVTEARPGHIRAVTHPGPLQLRPGDLVSGPTLMGLADMAAYALVLAHFGEVPMAVTSSLNIHFLRGCKPGPVTADATLLRLGRRLVTCDVRMWSDDPTRLVAHASVAYALPRV